jgi:hypothetical protein
MFPVIVRLPYVPEIAVSVPLQIGGPTVGSAVADADHTDTTTSAATPNRIRSHVFISTILLSRGFEVHACFDAQGSITSRRIPCPP